jgi:hypothetical protein
MKPVPSKQINTVLRQNSDDLSIPQKIIRKPLNSMLSEAVSSLFEIIFEPKSLFFSILLSNTLFIIYFFIGLIMSHQVTYDWLFLLLVSIYIILRSIKYIKNKIIR